MAKPQELKISYSALKSMLLSLRIERKGNKAFGECGRVISCYRWTQLL